MSRREPASAHPQSALDELLVAEREMAAAARKVEAECATTVADARAEAAEFGREAAASLQHELQALRAEAARERERETTRIADEASQTIHRYERLPDRVVAELAEFVATRVTGLDGEVAREAPT